METLAQKRIAVIGASRGLGRGIALALGAAGASVLATARGPKGLDSLADHGIDGRAGDAADPVFVRQLFEDETLDAFVLVAGARPVMASLSAYDWASFRRPFDVDAKAAFHFVQAALAHAPKPAHGVVISSGAALYGSPMSGGYAGAKQTQRFLVKYAAAEAKERALGLRLQTVLPQLNPNTALGVAGVRAYAAKAGVSPAEFVEARFGDRPLSPAIAGEAMVELLGTATHADAPELLLTGDGLRSVA